MIRISAHPEAEKPEEQHHKTPQAHVKFLLELLWLLFDLWGLDTRLDLTMVSMLLHSCAWIGLLTSIVRMYLCQNASGEILITKPYEQYIQRSETPRGRPKLLA